MRRENGEIVDFCRARKDHGAIIDFSAAHSFIDQTGSFPP
jgi:hypothetical protein